MRSSAPVERRLFWKEFEKKLSELGTPFDICYEVSGDIKYYASVNKTSPLVNLGLTIDFLYKESNVKINIYIRDNVDLFEYIHSNKEKIEDELGFIPQWIYYGERNPNTRRVISTFPVVVGNPLDYERVIKKVIPYIIQYKKVFTKYIPNLCDY